MQSGGNYEEYAGPQITQIDPEDQIQQTTSDGYNIKAITKSLIIILIVYLVL